MFITKECIKFMLFFVFREGIFSRILKVVNLSKQFMSKDWFSRVKVANALINLNCEFDDRNVIVGCTKSGKSTFMNCLCGKERISSGEIITTEDCITLEDTTEYMDSRYYLSYNSESTVSSLLTDPLLNRFTDIVSRAIKISGISVESKVSRLLESERKIFEMILGISRMKSTTNPILFLDEYFDKDLASTRRKISEALEKFSEELNLQTFIVTHSRSVMRDFSPRIFVIHKGRVYSEAASPEQLIIPRQLEIDMIP